MKTEIRKCDNCGKSSEDLYDEIGWIEIESPKSISISGGRRNGEGADVFRFISGYSSHTIDLCSLKCLIEFIYIKQGYFNNNEVKTLTDKLRVSENKDELQKLVSDINAVLFALVTQKGSEL